MSRWAPPASVATPAGVFAVRLFAQLPSYFLGFSFVTSYHFSLIKKPGRCPAKKRVAAGEGGRAGAGAGAGARRGPRAAFPADLSALLCLELGVTNKLLERWELAKEEAKGL